ncbi:MAG: hypothetical protein SF052_11080 [Bacteroidia bacterium]|nr:hypothetical protein [Bacteroidia bacterium]
MIRYDLFGFKESDLEKVKSEIETQLEILFTSHESMYKGGIYYRLGDILSENFELQKNIDLLDGEPLEDEFKDFPILLFVNRTIRSEEIVELLTGLNFKSFHLRSTTI